jgi:hypothetical protein
MDKRIEARIIDNAGLRVINKLLRDHYGISIRYSNNRRLLVSSVIPVKYESKGNNFESNTLGVVNDIDLLKMLGDRSMVRIGGGVGGVGGDGWNHYAPEIKVTKEHLKQIKTLMLISWCSE